MSESRSVEQSGNASETTEERGHWSSYAEFLLATIGSTVGLGNVWRFPALAYNNGGSAFLFPFFVCAVLFGLPTLYLEMLVGQYTNTGPSTLFKHYIPALQGLGWSMTLISLTVNIYYCVLISWTFIYLITSVTGMMSVWESCDNEWNDIYCTNETAMKECKRKDPLSPVAFNGTCIAKVLKEMKTPFDQYFTNVITKRSDGIDQIGEINWPVLSALALMWSSVILILLKGYKYMGKAAYIGSTFPYIVVVILFFRGITLEGASDGVYYYFGKPDLKRLLNHETWSAALVQVCYSLNVGYGAIIMLASYNSHYINCYRAAWIVIWGNLVMSVLCGIAVFATLGYLSHHIHKPIDEVVSDGLSLAFVAYPEALLEMPYPSVWVICFFTMLFCLGITSQVGFAETICTSIYDQWPVTRNFKWLVTLCCCMVSFACGIIMTTESGFFWFTLFDNFCASTSACIVVTAELLIFMYFYGYSNIRQDIYEMLGKPADNVLTRLIGPTAPLWEFCWKFISPTIGILILFFMLMRSELTVEHRSKIYRYPQWAVYFGYFLSLVPLVPIPVYFVVNAVKWTKEGSPLSSMFTTQPSLVSYNRVNGLAEFGIRPKDYEGEFTISYAGPSASTSVPSDITSPETLSS